MTANAAERERMREFYRCGGKKRQAAPHIVHPAAVCPHAGCDQPMQAIDFRLEDHGRAVHAPLVQAWRDDTGFAGRCPRCGGWVHFTLGGKRAVSAEEASRLPRLPDGWAERATVL